MLGKKATIAATYGLLWLTGCNAPSGPFSGPFGTPGGAAQPQPEETDGGDAPPEDARTVEEFDTTSAEEREAAVVQASAGGGALLGSTIAALGDPTDPGLWARTPLVEDVTQGRLEYPALGTSVAVELRPLSGDPGAGTQVSLAAFRLLQAPLADLVELQVYRQ